jgi:RND family efflux transporter MFP subunit
VRQYLGAALLVAAAACGKKQQAPTVQTAMVTRRDIIVQATGNGTIEPITIIDVKSKASGVITQMPVETGTDVKPGDLLVQVDTRDVQNKYNQAKAALDAAEAKLQVAESNKKRNEDMFKARVITPQEYEQVEVDYANANSGVVSAKAKLDLANQAL